MNEQQEPITQHGLSTHPEPSATAQRAAQMEGKTVSTADNVSFETGAGAEATGYDSPANASDYLSNADLDPQAASGEDVRPTGAWADAERSRDSTEESYRK